MWLMFIKFIMTSMKGTAILTLVIRLQKLAMPAIGGVSAGAPSVYSPGGDIRDKAILDSCPIISKSNC